MPIPKKQSPITIPRPKNATGVLGRIQPIGFDAEIGIKLNIYGRSGTGKTHLVGTFPKPILAVICSGPNPGELRTLDTEANRKVIHQVVLDRSDELDQLCDYQEETNTYKTIALDHVSGLQDMVLRELLKVDELPVQKSWGMASRDTWSECGMRVKERLRRMFKLNCNIVIVAQERDFSSENDGIAAELLTPMVASALTPSVVGWLNPAVDYIVQTFIRLKTIETEVEVNGKKVKGPPEVTREIEFCARTGPDPMYTTKFRVPHGKQLPNVIVDPTYEKIYKLIRGM